MPPRPASLRSRRSSRAACCTSSARVSATGAASSASARSPTTPRGKPARAYTPIAMTTRTDRYDLACAVVLAALTVVSRLPYRARMLYNWDAVQLALALNEYDVVKHQPHPPGYILYVALGRLVNHWLRDPAAAYVVLAVVFSGLTTFVVYYLARAVYDRATALASGTLLAVSPL